MKKDVVIELDKVSKKFELRDKTISALKDVTLTFEKGKFYGIVGHSGSGKSTLINIIGLLENIFDGSYKIKGIDVKNINFEEEAKLRRDFIGFVFQDFYLDEYLKSYENVMLPMIVNKDISKDKRMKRALELLNKVDLSERINHFPKEMSGGEKQRVAIARALANDPEIILADEPTGNLDEDNEKKVFEILKQLSDEGKCVIVVSHSNEIYNYADVVYKLKSGKLVKE